MTCKFTIMITRFSRQKKRQGASADELQVKAAKILPLVVLARSKQDPINRGHGAQHSYRPTSRGLHTDGPELHGNA